MSNYYKSRRDTKEDRTPRRRQRYEEEEKEEKPKWPTNSADHEDWVRRLHLANRGGNVYPNGLNRHWTEALKMESAIQKIRHGTDKDGYKIAMAVWKSKHLKSPAIPK